MEVGQRGTLDVAHVADGDDHLVVGIEVFGIEFLAGVDDFGAPLVAELLLHFHQFVLDDLHAKVVVAQNLLEIFYLFQQLVVFAPELLLHQVGQLAEAHFHDGLGLHLVQFEARHQAFDGGLRILGGTYDVDHLVDVVAGNDQPFQDVCPLLGLPQIVPCAADDHVVAVLHEVGDAVFQRKQARAPLDERDAVHTEAGLQGRHFEQFVQHHVGVGIALHVHHDAHAFAVGLVVDIADAVNLLVVHQVGNLLDELGLVHAVGNLRDHDFVVALSRLDFGACPHDDAAAPRLVGLAHALHAIDESPRGEIGRLDVFHQSVNVDVGVVDVGHTGVDDLT